MRWLVALGVLVCSATLVAQSLPTHDEIFKAIYVKHYEVAKDRGIWHCPEAQAAAFNECADDSKPELSILKVVVLEDDDEISAYALTSAASGSDCHSCAPLLGMAIFRWQKDKWIVKAAKSDAARFGAWDRPPDFSLVQIGPHSYGFMLTLTDGGQGYLSTRAELLAMRIDSIGRIWEGLLGEDNSGAVDLSDKYAEHRIVHSTAAYMFYPQDPNAANYDADHYDLQVISRGNGYGYDGIVKSQSWNTLYRIENGTYELIKRTRFRESKATRR